MSIILQESFTDTDGTVLSSHTGENGLTWTQHASFPISTFTIENNRVAKDTASQSALYYASAVSPSLFYEISCTIVDKSAVVRTMGVFGWMDTASDTMLGVRRQNETTWQFLKIINNVGTTIATASETFSAEASHTLRLRRIPETNDFEWFIDGVSQGVFTVNDSEFQSVGKIGIRATGGAGGPTVGFHLDDLSATSATAPNALFRGRNYLLFDDEDVNRFEFWPAVAAGAADLVVQNASHAHVADNVVVTQVHNLVVQDAVHGHTAQNVVVTQEHLLAVQNAAHSHTADNIVLSQEHNVTVQNAAHSHTAENAVLTQVHGLTVQDAAHAHNAENVALTQTHELAVQNATHTHVAENVTINTSANLVVQNAEHAHTAESPALSQVHSLAVDNAAHAHTAQNVVLAQEHQIIVQSATHGHIAESLLLTQVHTLAINAAFHAHAADNVVLGGSGDLEVQNAVHGHTAQNVTITQEHGLVVQDAQHAHTAESLTLSQEHVLAVENALHNHIATTLTLGQEHNLIVSDAFHAHTAENVVFPSADTSSRGASSSRSATISFGSVSAGIVNAARSASVVVRR